MSEVKRYECNGSSSVFEDENGSLVAYVDYAALESKCVDMAAEVSALKDINKWCKTDAFSNMYREFKTAQAVGCCNVDCMHDAMVVAIMHAPETPSTDAFLDEVRVSAIPEGYVLVPQQIFLEPSDIESICSQCGDGHEYGYGYFTDGLLWIGNIQRDDGSIVHGLHISSADYSEEGGVTVCEFAAQLRTGGNQ